MALQAWIGEYPETLSSKTFRSAQPDYPHTLAMHWDGTYRDRRNVNKGLQGFISADEWPRDPAICLAKHLA